jgi:flagellar biosynthesis chaperone FliJ
MLPAYAFVQVSQGKADAKQLAQEKQRLGKMQQKLEVLEDEKTKTASRANSLLSFLGLGGSSKVESSGSAAAASGSSSAAGKQGIVSKSRGSLPGPAQQQPQQAEQSGSKNVLVSTWEALGQQLLQLEGRLSEQESKTQRQRLSVQQLKEKVGQGHVIVAILLGSYKLCKCCSLQACVL